VSRDIALFPITVIAALLQLFLLSQLVYPLVGVLANPVFWLAFHVASAVFFGLAAGYWLGAHTDLKSSSAAVMLGIMALCMPGVGGIAAFLAVSIGHHVWEKRAAEITDLVVTENIALPFTTPIGRRASVPDSRGFIEQLRYSDDSDALYQKVLSSGYIRNSISVGVLREAVTHSDERIRLTAYQILDRKVNDLNSEIQRLEAEADTGDIESQGTTWLQVANNYWELLTLENSDLVARQQLLKKVIDSAKKSVSCNSENRNAHLVLGRACLADKKFNQADVAFQRAMSLGMPADKVVPYLAEVAFGKREFGKVKKLLESLDNAFKEYPPLKQVTEYWS